MKLIRSLLIASLSLALCAIGPLASAQPKSNETAGQAPAADGKVSKEERAAARKARRAAAAKANKEAIRGTNSTGAGDKPAQVPAK